MYTETKNEKSQKTRAAVTIGHRKRKGLCIKCGCDVHEGICIENYKQADNRKIQIEGKLIDIRRKKISIISYRKRKKLCIKCGQDYHSDIKNCIDNYDQVDNRPITEKIERPAIILAPKDNPIQILEDIKRTESLKVNIDPIRIIKLQRDFVVVDIRSSETGKHVEFSCLNQISLKFKDYIICIVGKIEKVFSYSDYLKSKKLLNIHEIQNQTDQEIVNYICGSIKYYGFDDRYTSICLKHKISFYTFMPNRDADMMLPEYAYCIKGDDNG
jgi:hypothetical protein